MKKTLFAVFLALLLTGCFETDFNFKTTVSRNGNIQREVQINGRGPNRFLPPSGPQWEIIKAESRPGPSLLGDQEHHIHAVGRFKDAKEFSSDFLYNVAPVVEGLDEAKRSELRETLGIPEPFEQEIGTANRIEFTRKRSFFATEYHYAESFEIRHLIPMLLHDLKGEILKEAATKPIEQGAPAAVEIPAEELALQKLKEEILPKFQFHSEVTLPGKVIRSNATKVHNTTAIWDFRADNFDAGFTNYRIEVVSRASNVGIVIASTLILLAIVWAFLFTKQRGGVKGSGKK